MTEEFEDMIEEVEDEVVEESQSVFQCRRSDY